METDRANLYNRWRKIIELPHDLIFDTFETFYYWALASGYHIGARLVLKDPALPYSPENCEWKIEKAEHSWNTAETRESITRWNRTVNVFRRACGLPPFEEDSEAITLK